MTTGDRIKQLRLALGMSQEELGQKVGVKKAAINKYETGIVVNLKRSVIDKLSTALHTTPSYLMGWDTAATEPKDKDDEDDELEVFMLGGGSTIHKVKKAPAFSKEKQELIKIVEKMDEAQVEALLKLLKK